MKEQLALNLSPNTLYYVACLVAMPLVAGISYYKLRQEAKRNQKPREIKRRKPQQ